MSIKADFNEATQSQLPFAEVLVNMGYRYISVEEIKELRNEDSSKIILREITEKKLMEINFYEKSGENMKFTPAEISRAVDELEKIDLEQDGLIEASKKKYQMLMSKTSGISIKIDGDGKDKSKDLVFVDFNNVENNDFAFTVEYEVFGKNNIRADIVVFVNGIPFSVIENKKSSIEIDEAVNQLNKYQNTEHSPKLFVYPQLLVATNKSELKYGTTKTPKKFYTKWREKDIENVSGYINKDDEIKEIISQEIDEGIYKNILKDLNGASFKHKQIKERKVSEQDRGIYFLLKKERLLDLESNFVIYDGKIKKMMRYQQFFGIKKIFKRIHQIEISPRGERRRGGIIWHTQGSGKSLTMVNLAKEIIEDPEIINPRIIILTDRVDLDKQIKDTFKNGGLKKEIYRTVSGKDLISKIKNKDSRVLTTLVQKFDTASKKNANFEDLDKNIFVLIDEAHRSHGGEASIRMDKIIPNACYVAFTGTPLLKNDKTEKKFGAFIDKYTIDDALDDGIVLPLFYESRYTELNQDKERIDKKLNREVRGANQKEIKEIQKKIRSKVLKNNPQRIEEIARDIEKHFSEKFAGSGLKAQLVAPSQFSAVLFQEYFEENSDIKTAVVLSGVKEDEADDHKVKVNNFTNKIREDYGSLKRYEEGMVSDFKYNKSELGGVEILIVVDKLLTGFDAPRNTVLYLTKEIRDHNLLQAIARVNRLFDNENKEVPKTAGFVIDYSENGKNLKDAMELFGKIKDEKDVKNSLFDLKDKINDLENSYDKVQDFFKVVKNREDDEEYIEIFRGNEKKRQDFYNKVNTFVKDFSEASVFRDFVHEFNNYEIYARDLNKILNLKRTISLRYSDKVDFSKYKNAITRILDKYVDASEVRVLIAEIDIADFTKEIKKNLKTDKAKAEAIAAKMEKTIDGKRESDPDFYNKFSEKVKSVIDKMNSKKIADLEALRQLEIWDKEMENKKDDSLPKKIRVVGNSDIFYRNLKDLFKKYNFSDERYVEIIIDIFELLKSEMIVDFQNNVDTLRKMKNKIDDYLYDNLKVEDFKESGIIQDRVIELLKFNIDKFKK